MKKMFWIFSRLSRMPLLEIIHRVKECFYKKIDKIIIDWYGKTLDKNKAYKYLDLQSFFNLNKSESKVLKRVYPDEVKKIILEADEIINNRLKVFNIAIDYRKRINWHKDPKTKRNWQRDKFWTEIDIRDGFKIGGAKFVWEINRFYFMPVLGLAFYLTNKKKYADKIFFLLSDWMRNNPYAYGVNWTSNIELAVRVLNIIWAFSYLKGYNLSLENKKLINRFIQLHAYHIYRYPSKFSSCNNHALAEALALFVIGVYFKHLRDSNKWYDFGKKVFEREIAKQILPDGGSIEMTTTYLSFTADMALLYKIICDRNGISYTSTIDQRLKNTAGFISTIMDKKLNIPNIGDQDDAIAVNFQQSNKENFKSLLNTLSIIYNIHGIAKNKEIDLKTYLLIDKIKNKYYNHKKVQGQRHVKYFKNRGLITIKHIINDKEIYWCWNISRMGMPPLYAHGHLDVLSFYLSIDGNEFFIDPGTYLYQSGGKWRKYFRSNSAHNTIKIDHKDFSLQKGEFIYGSAYIQDLIEFKNNSKKVYIKMAVKFNNLSVIREFEYFFNNKNFNIVDSISQSRNGRIEQFFHLHPECKVKNTNGNIIIKRGNVGLSLFPDKDVKTEFFYGTQKPILGWYSPNFNTIQKTTTIRTFTDLSDKYKIVTEGRIL